MGISKQGLYQAVMAVVLSITDPIYHETRPAHMEHIAVKAAGSHSDNHHRKVKAIFSMNVTDAYSDGWDSAESAVIGFFATYDARYLALAQNREMAGFILKCRGGRYYFTTAVETPLMMTLQASIARPGKCGAVAFLHTHPPAEEDGQLANRQERFSEFDRQGAISSRLEYYMRTPRGDVRYMNRKIARSTLAEIGVPGRSICPTVNPCLKPHPMQPEAHPMTVSVRF